MASCTNSSFPGRDGAGVAYGTLQYLHDRRSQKTYVAPGSQTNALEGVVNPDFLALGLGGTNLMAVLWAVAMGKRAVGVELRGDPTLGVHWNIREDFFHQLGLLDQLMLNRYGEDLLPHRDNGQLFSLADSFYSPLTRSGDVVPDEIIDGYDAEQHIVGAIQHVEFIDDRYKDGFPNRTISELPPPIPPAAANPMRIRGNMQDVLDGPSTFQASAAFIQTLLRRYLERIEEMDLEAGRYPRVRLFTRHRAVEKEGFGFIRQADGRIQVRIEEVTEMDFKGETVRLRTPGSDIIDIGVPKLFSIAQGANSSDARALGFVQSDVEVDHGDGRGPIVAQADYIAGLFDALVDGRLRRRIASYFDEHGDEYWVRQIAVGHENDPEVAWVLVQVPDNMSFDPIEAGLVAPNTCESSAEYFAAYQILLQDFYLEQAALILGMQVHELRKVEQVYGPKLFSLVERMGADACIAPNGIVAGDSFGNGHFMTSGGAMTGMIGHGFRFLEHWQRCTEEFDSDLSVHLLADRIKDDTEAWLAVSAKEFTEATPINFGAERGAQIAAASGIDASVRARDVAIARDHRHGLVPLDASDWRRLFVKNGRVRSAPLPPISPVHPDMTDEIATQLEMSRAKAIPSIGADPAEVMMGAAPMTVPESSAALNIIRSLEEEVERLRLQHHRTIIEANGNSPRNLPVNVLQSDEERKPRLTLLPRRSTTALHSTKSSMASVGDTLSSSLSLTQAADTQAREARRLTKNLELRRQQENLYHQISMLNDQMVTTPPTEEPSRLAAYDPATLITKVLGTQANTEDSFTRRSLTDYQKRPSLSTASSNGSSSSASSIRSFTPVSRPASATSSMHSLRYASSRSSSSGRSPSPSVQYDHKSKLASMPEDEHTGARDVTQRQYARNMYQRAQAGLQATSRSQKQ